MAIQTFFGEDLNGDPLTALTSFPNSIAASLQWKALMASWQTQGFDAMPGNDLVANGGYNVAPVAGSGVPLALSWATLGITATLTATSPYLGNYSALNFIDPASGFSTDGDGRYAVSLPNYFIDIAPDLVLTFHTAIAAFGFFGIDIGDFGSVFSLTLTRSDGVKVEVPVPASVGSGADSPADGSVLFFGMLDRTQTYTAIRFNNNLAGVDVFAFDNFSVGILPPPRPVGPPATAVFFR